ncbi:MAG: hypothetical protein MN733_16655, partial [Nitrososphaera sp.]|nr:hypothetical protein [Nitrososphaera sp.]
FAAFGTFDNYALMMMRIYLFESKETFRTAADRIPEDPVTVLQMITPDNNRDKYLDACFKTARDLKAAGARVVMMELPWLPVTPENIKKVDEINKTGIVVFGTHFSGFDPNLEYKYRRTQPPLMGKVDLSWGQITYPESIGLRFPSAFQMFMNPFIPYGTTDVRTGKIVPDYAIEALRKYVGANEIRHEGREIVIGDIRLPVSSDGTLVSYNRSGSFPLFTWSAAVLFDEKISEPRYSVLKSQSRTDMSRTIQELEEYFRDKIVYIKWDEANNPNLTRWSDAGAYSVLISNALSGKNILRKADGWSLALILVCVGICGFISKFVRGLWAVPLMALFVVGIYLGAAWLLHEQSIMLDASYPMAAVILSIAVFPLARFAWTMRAVTPQAAASLIPEPVTQPEIRTTGSGWFAFTGEKLSLSLPLAAIVLLTAIGGSVLLTSLLQKPEIQQEPVYIMSMPTVEVQGYYSPSNGSAQ